MNFRKAGLLILFLVLPLATYPQVTSTYRPDGVVNVLTPDLPFQAERVTRSEQRLVFAILSTVRKALIVFTGARTSKPGQWAIAFLAEDAKTTIGKLRIVRDAGALLRIVAKLRGNEARVKTAILNIGQGSEWGDCLRISAGISAYDDGFFNLFDVGDRAHASRATNPCQ
jgi:hypothetical protein